MCELPFAERAMFRGQQDLVEHAVGAREATTALPAPGDVRIRRGFAMFARQTQVVVDARDIGRVTRRTTGHQPLGSRAGERRRARGKRRR